MSRPKLHSSLNKEENNDYFPLAADRSVKFNSPIITQVYERKHTFVFRKAILFISANKNFEAPSKL